MYVVLVCTLTCGLWSVVFFFQAEDGIRDLVRSRGLGDVYKRQVQVELPLLHLSRDDEPQFCVPGAGRSAPNGLRGLSLIHI